MAMLCDPFSGDFSKSPGCALEFPHYSRPANDDNNHFNRTLRTLATPNRFQTPNQIRLVEARNDDGQSEVRFGGAAICRSQNPKRRK